MLITTLVVSFCKDGGGSVSVKLWFLVVCVRCEVLCRLVVVGNVFLIILINTNKTSSYQSTNETHYTHKVSQLLISTETRYQLQPSDKEHHTEHTPLRTLILH